VSDMSGWDVAGVIAKQLGGRLVNGVVERHTGINDIDVAGTAGMVGTAVVPIIASAYRGQPDDTWVWRWERRIRWTFGLGLGVGAIVGGGYLAWKYLRKPSVDS